MERLQRGQITGAMLADKRFCSHVGIGSSGHDFEGTVLISVRISSSVGSKVDRGGAGLSAISGCGVAAGDVLIFCTLLLKKSAKSPADSLDDVPCCGGWSRLSTHFQRYRGFLHALTVSDQNVVNFA